MNDKQFRVLLAIIILLAIFVLSLAKPDHIVWKQTKKMFGTVINTQEFEAPEVLPFPFRWGSPAFIAVAQGGQSGTPDYLYGDQRLQDTMRKFDDATMQQNQRINDMMRMQQNNPADTMRRLDDVHMQQQQRLDDMMRMQPIRY